jgi:hypothetical protein
MRLVKLAVAAVALAVSGTAVAAGFVVKLEPGSAGIVRGHAGLHAVDEKTQNALVRVIAPGLKIDKRGTIRVLVMNLGTEPFEFGPDDVSLTLADGSELKQVPLKEFARGYSIIKRGRDRAAAVDMQNRNMLSTLGGQTQSGMTAPGGAPTPAGSTPDVTDVNSISRRTDENLLRGSKDLDMISQVLMPDSVAPQKAAGGYLVFELPKEARAAAGDLPLTIAVRTGGEVHRFAGRLERR